MQMVLILFSSAAEGPDDNIPTLMNSVFELDDLHISHSPKYVDRHPPMNPDLFIPVNLDEGEDA